MGDNFGPEEYGPDPALYRRLLLPETVRLERLNDSLDKVRRLVKDANDGLTREGCPL